MTSATGIMFNAENGILGFGEILLTNKNIDNGLIIKALNSNSAFSLMGNKSQIEEALSLTLTERDSGAYILRVSPGISEVSLPSIVNDGIVYNFAVGIGSIQITPSSGSFICYSNGQVPINSGISYLQIQSGVLGLLSDNNGNWHTTYEYGNLVEG